MGRQLIDMIGRKYGKLTVVSRAGSNQFGHPKWNCLCECGNTTVVKGSDLRAGGHKSCSCAKTTHGQYGSGLYAVWNSMMDRCNVPTSIGYPNYGARGITVCERWKDIRNFVSDMLPTYAPGLLLDRIDNDGNYCPENCRWATRNQQQRNTSKNRRIKFNGETKCLIEWAEQFGIHKQTLYNRLERGMPIEQALTKPVKKSKRQLQESVN